MRILCLDSPCPRRDAGTLCAAPYRRSPARLGTVQVVALFATSFPSGDRPGVAIFLECDTVEEANNVMAEFPLAKAGLLTFECIPLGLRLLAGKILSAEFKHQE